jgi:hypothetical protein
MTSPIRSLLRLAAPSLTALRPAGLGPERIRLAAGLAALFLLGAGPSPGPPGLEIVPAPGLQVSKDAPGTRHVESVLAIDPRNPQRLVAASMVLGEAGGIAVYASSDGGRSWRRGTRAPDGGSLFDGQDPSVTFGPDGTVYLLCLGDELAAWTSRDGGRRWGDRTVVPGSRWDRSWIRVGAGSRRAPRGRLFVAGKLPLTVFDHIVRDIAALSTSDGPGTAFSFPRLLLPDPDEVSLNTVSDLVVAPDGRVILTFQLFDLQDFMAPLLSGSLMTIVSEDGGRTFTEPRPGPAFHAYGHGWEGKSLLGLGGGAMAIDTSGGPRDGRLYLTWVDAAGGFYRVMEASSDDGGASWSSPVPVSGDDSRTDQSTPAIAVDGHGVLGISWYDRRADPTDRCYQLHFAASADGGRAFSAARRLDDRPTCPLAGRSSGRGSVDPVASGYRFKNGGDTQGLVGLPGGGFHLAWIGSGTEELQLWSTAVAVRPEPTDAQGPARTRSGAARAP